MEQYCEKGITGTYGAKDRIGGTEHGITLGGLGHMGVKFAHAMGTHVVMITTSEKKGAVATDVYQQMPGFLQPVIKLFMLTPEQGAQTTLYLASSPVSELKNGAYYDKSKEKKTSEARRNMELAESLWNHSENWLSV